MNTYLVSERPAAPLLPASSISATEYCRACNGDGGYWDGDYPQGRWVTCRLCSGTGHRVAAQARSLMELIAIETMASHS